MPSPRAVLADITEFKLDPTVAHVVTHGRRLAKVQVENKAELPKVHVKHEPEAVKEVIAPPPPPPVVEEPVAVVTAPEPVPEVEPEVPVFAAPVVEQPIVEEKVEETPKKRNKRSQAEKA